MEDLVNILNALEVDPNEFFSAIFEGTRSRYLDPSCTTPNVSTELAIIADELRYEEPIKALRLLSKHEAQHGGDSLFYRVLGSTYRLLELDEQAVCYIRKGITLAQSDLEKANGLQRLAFTQYHQKQVAIDHLLKAAQLYSRNGCVRGYSETLVDRGIVFYSFGDLVTSQGLLLEGITNKAYLSRRYQVSAHQVLAKVYQALKYTNLARRSLELSLAASEGNLDSYTKGHLHWTYGLLHHDTAALDRAMEAFSKAHFYHAIGAGLDKCRLVPSSTGKTLDALFTISQSQPEFRDLLWEWISSAELKKPIRSPHAELRLTWHRWRMAQVRRILAAS